MPRQKTGQEQTKISSIEDTTSLEIINIENEDQQ